MRDTKIRHHSKKTNERDQKQTLYCRDTRGFSIRAKTRVQEGSLITRCTSPFTSIDTSPSCWIVVLIFSSNTMCTFLEREQRDRGKPSCLTHSAQNREGKLLFDRLRERDRRCRLSCCRMRGRLRHRLRLLV